jgi:hypothetical protein
MSTKVKERLKKLMLELDHEERMFLDEALENKSGKTCDEAIELLSDEQVMELARRIIARRKK